MDLSVGPTCPRGTNLLSLSQVESMKDDETRREEEEEIKEKERDFPLRFPIGFVFLNTQRAKKKEIDFISNIWK